MHLNLANKAKIRKERKMTKWSKIRVVYHVRFEIKRKLENKNLSKNNKKAKIVNLLEHN